MNKILFSIFLMSSSFSVLANETDFSGELLFGKTDQDYESKAGAVAHGDDTSYGIRGAYHFNPQFAIEISYVDYGDADYRFIDSFGDTIDDTISSSAINTGIKGSIPFKNGLAVIGRVGVSFWDVELVQTDSSLPGVASVGEDSGEDLYVGAGAQYLISESFFIGLEYTFSELGVKPDRDFSGEVADIKVETLALTAGFNF